MKVIKVNTPDGKVLSLSSPDDATPEEINQAVAQAATQYMASNPQAGESTGSKILKNAKASLQGMAHLARKTAELPYEAIQSGRQVLGGANAGDTTFGKDLLAANEAIVSAFPSAHRDANGKIAVDAGGIARGIGGIAKQYTDIGAQPFKMIPGKVGEEFKKAYPGNPFVDQPVETALAMLPFAKPIAGAAEVAGSAASKAAKSALALGKAGKETVLGQGLKDAELVAAQAKANFEPLHQNAVRANAAEYLPKMEAKVNELQQQVKDLQESLKIQGPQETAVANKAATKLRPTEDLLQQQKQYQNMLSVQETRKEGELAAQNQELNLNLGEIEKKAGIPFKTTPRFEKFIQNRSLVSDLAQKLEQATPADLKGMSSSRLQRWRKLATEAKKAGTISDLGDTSLSKGMQTTAEELGNRIPDFKEARMNIKANYEAQANLPKEIEAKRATIKNQILTTKARLDEQASEFKNATDQARFRDKRESIGLKKAAETQLNEAQAELKAHQRLIKQMEQKAKTADARGLLELENKHTELMRKAAHRDKVRKVLGYTALGGLLGGGVAGGIKSMLGH